MKPTARGKGAKRRARRARQGGIREPNGRISRKKDDVNAREKQEQDKTMAPAVDARMRIFGMTEAVAKMRESGSVIGRMVAPDSQQTSETLTMAQFEALETLRDAHNAYQRAIGVKEPDSGNPPPAPVFERSGDYDRFVAAAKARWATVTLEIQSAVVAAERLTLRRPLAWAALYTFVVEDKFDAGLVGDLKMVADVFVVRPAKSKIVSWRESA